MLFRLELWDAGEIGAKRYSHIKPVSFYDHMVTLTILTLIHLSDMFGFGRWDINMLFSVQS